MTNIVGNDDWKTCFVVNDVDLPTGYYFGATAATGDLAGVCVLTPESSARCRVIVNCE